MECAYGPLVSSRPTVCICMQTKAAQRVSKVRAHWLPWRGRQMEAKQAPDKGRKNSEVGGKGTRYLYMRSMSISGSSWNSRIFTVSDKMLLRFLRSSSTWNQNKIR